jgi:hypothetical protein
MSRPFTAAKKAEADISSASLGPWPATGFDLLKSPLGQKNWVSEEKTPKSTDIFFFAYRNIVYGT